MVWGLDPPVLPAFLKAVSRAAPLIKYLRQLECGGQTHIRLDEEAKEVLRSRLRMRKESTSTPPPLRSQGVASLSAEANPSDRKETTPPSVPAVQAEGGTATEKLASLKSQGGATLEAVTDFRIQVPGGKTFNFLVDDIRLRKKNPQQAAGGPRKR